MLNLAKKSSARCQHANQSHNLEDNLTGIHLQCVVNFLRSFRTAIFSRFLSRTYSGPSTEFSFLWILLNLSICLLTSRVECRSTSVAAFSKRGWQLYCQSVLISKARPDMPPCPTRITCCQRHSAVYSSVTGAKTYSRGGRWPSRYLQSTESQRSETYGMGL